MLDYELALEVSVIAGSRAETTDRPLRIVMPPSTTTDRYLMVDCLVKVNLLLNWREASVMVRNWWSDIMNYDN